MKLFYLDRFAAFHHVQLTQTLFRIFCFIVQCVITLDYAGSYLYHRIFSDKRIYDRLPNICGFRFCEIVICFKYFLRLHIDTGNITLFRRRHIAYDIIEKDLDTLKIQAGAHRNRNDRYIVHIRMKRCNDLGFGEFFTVEITIHQLLTRLGNCLKQMFSVMSQIILKIIRYRTLHLFLLIYVSSCCTLNNVHVTYKLFILTDRNMKRSNLLSVQLCQSLYNLSVAGIVIVHIGNVDKSRQFILLAKLPSFLCTYFYAVLSINNDNCRICCCRCFLCLSKEVKVSRCIQDINLCIAPNDRNHCGAD